MIRHLVRAMAAVVVIQATAPAWAEENPPCAKRDLVVDRLQSHYDEMHAGTGLQTKSDSQTLVEVWASQETGTFTVMLTTPQGVSCVLATGTDWQFGALAPSETDEAS